MKKLSLVSLLLLAACANDPQAGAVVGGAAGGATGAAVGYGVGGRDGAIIGGAIGGAAGAAIGHSQSGSAQQPAVRRESVPQSGRGEGEYRDDRGERGDHHRKKHEHEGEED